MALPSILQTCSAEQGLEFAPSHVFRQLRKLDIAADAALRADGELVDRQMLGRLVDTTQEEVKKL